MTSKNQNPKDQIKANNPWYTDEQFSRQYKQPGPRAVIENRWKIFQKAIESYKNQKGKSSSTTPFRILDAGCGDGINLFGLNKIIQSQNLKAQIYGVDYNPLRLERASQFPFVEEINQSPLDNLSYADDWFDVIICNQVLEHIPQDKKVLQEFSRVIRPGGMLILGVPNEGCFLGRLRNHIIQPSILKNTDHVNFYTEKKVLDLLAESNFSNEYVEKPGFFLPHTVLHFLMAYTAVGRWLLNTFGKIWKSQCAELILVSTKI